MSRRVLLMLSQSPFDPSSGAARSMRGIAEMLASQGFAVRCIGTTATEGSPTSEEKGRDHADLVRSAGGTSQWVTLPGRGNSVGPSSGGDRVLVVERRGVEYLLVDVGRAGPSEWESRWGATFDGLLTRELMEYPADVLLTMGGSPSERARRRYVRQRGAAVVFGLRNLSYLDRRAFADVDAVLVPSQFMQGLYRQAIGLESVAIPPPLDPDDVLARNEPGSAERRFVTVINPTPSKGVAVVARLFEELSVRKPGIELLVVEARGTAGALVACGLRGGFDLRRHRNIQASPGVSRPRDIWEVTRVGVVPSLWREPSGRVAAEALVNGVVPIVSDRGGLPETVGDGGIVLGLPDTLTPETIDPVGVESVEAWIERVLELVEHDGLYASASVRAQRSGERFGWDRLAEAYSAFFGEIERGTDETPGPGLGGSR